MIINGKTKIYGIIGRPIEHTLSPGMQNAAYEAAGMNAVYIPFEIRPENLQSALKAFKMLGIAGFNITIPHKTTCMRFLDKIDDTAKLIGAVNTVKIVGANGRSPLLVGYNTDGPGFLLSLQKDLDITPKGKTAFVIGAGGAARAVVWALAKNGAKTIIVADKIKEKAEELANTFSFMCDVRDVRDEGDWTDYIRASDILINASPVGMKDADSAPVDTKLLHKDLAVFDLIYNKHTRLVRSARLRGLKACGGFGMLLYQGVLAYQIWTDKKAPVAIMRNALISQFSLRGPRNVRWWS